MLKRRPIIAALIVAAGSGERFGSDVPKQYTPFSGKPLLQWSIEMFSKHPLISTIYTVIHPDHIELFKNTVQDVRPVLGSNTRQGSVRKGLEALKGLKPDYVLIHDAARPLLSDALITKLCEEVLLEQAVIPGIPVTDTIKRQIDGSLKTENRDHLYTVQTPQAFQFGKIYDLHKKYYDVNVTDDAALYEADGQSVKIISGQRDNIKITHPEDLALAEQYLSSKLGDIRTGQGYDVHKLVQKKSPDEVLKLCGISIPHDKKLKGHSDADVGLHAITDAILGCIGDGDIGEHFPPSETKWKNADSAFFLKHAENLVLEKGGIISHMDITLICEEPKITPHKQAMRQHISKLLQVSENRISIKATTTEGLGFTGRGEGIIAQATVTIRLPFNTNKRTRTTEEQQKWAS